MRAGPRAQKANSMETISTRNNVMLESESVATLSIGSRGAILVEHEIGQQVNDVKAGTVLLLEGDESKSMLFVTNGWLSLSKSLADGRTQIIDLALPGDIVDPSSADGATTPFSVEALTPASIASIPFHRWEEMLGSEPDLRHRVHAFDAAEQARRAERMLRLGKGTAETRVAYALMELCVRLGCPGLTDNTPMFHVPLTQQQIGDFIGLSSVHVCRTLRRMKRNRVVEMTGHMDLRILDPEAMADLAGVDAETLRSEIIPG